MILCARSIPHHIDIAIDRPDDYHFTAGYEANDVRPDTDFDLYWSVSPDAVGASVVTYVDDNGDGYFLLLAAPGIDANSEIIAKDVIVVLDTSGSMEGEKFAQAQEALLYVLDHLNADDRFNIVEFSTGAREFARSLQPSSAAADAEDWVGNLSAGRHRHQPGPAGCARYGGTGPAGDGPFPYRRSPNRRRDR